MTNKTIDHRFEHFTAHRYEVLAAVPNGAKLESYRVRSWYTRMNDRICELANAGFNFEVVTKIQNDTCYWVAVDTNYEGEIEMEAIALPTFKDLVADEVAKYLQIRQERLVGDENPSFVLDDIASALRSGDWKRYENVEPKGSS